MLCNLVLDLWIGIPARVSISRFCQALICPRDCSFDDGQIIVLNHHEIEKGRCVIF